MKGEEEEEEERRVKPVLYLVESVEVGSSKIFNKGKIISRKKKKKKRNEKRVRALS